MKLLIFFAAIWAVTSAGQYSQTPAEIYQAIEFQDHQSRGNGHAFDGGYQGHQVVQSFQHQPVQHQNIQTHQVQAQPQHVQFQSQPQQVHIQKQPQILQFQSHSDQSSHIGQLSNHIGQSQHSSSGQNVGYHGIENNQNKEARILNYQHDSDEHNYQYAYETENGIKAQEVGTTVGEGTKTQGAYSYTGDDGQVYTVTYTADENGFHPSGAHLPTPPPIPDEIARSIEHNLRDEANGIVDDGYYHHQQDQQEQYTQQSQQHQQKQQPSHGLFQQLQRHNYEQTHQQQPSTVVHQVQLQKQEQIQPQQKQETLGVFQQLKQQNLLQPAQQHVIVQQVQQVPQIDVHHQQPLPQIAVQYQQQQLVPQVAVHNQQQQLVHHQQPLPNIFKRFQRQPKPVHHQKHQSLIQQQVLPHVEEHRHVEYIIPTITKNFRKQRTDDYVGPAPAPVTENPY